MHLLFLMFDLLTRSVLLGVNEDHVCLRLLESREVRCVFKGKARLSARKVQEFV